ncbi:methyltransferase domain-containing protein [Neptuniibacter sp.]|uniref:methyltransferase domain-containing protein n=1 Tax=Neptuniibacter sp. TaxID=1962643 RepID=UPI00262ADB08|nr:methyltransferase domain-containing protein [Neptuniibacter sp.]MCP4598626.1 methyltransferase domain-containing protein [Neptuniibacter sp.]
MSQQESITELVQRIRSKSEAMSEVVDQVSDHSESALESNVLPFPDQQSYLSFPLKKRYHINEFLWIESDEDFVRQAYQHLLGREPDSEGFEAYLNELKVGEFRVNVLHLLAASEEAKTRGVHLRGFRRCSTLYRSLVAKTGGLGRKISGFAKWANVRYLRPLSEGRNSLPLQFAGIKQYQAEMNSCLDARDNEIASLNQALKESRKATSLLKSEIGIYHRTLNTYCRNLEEQSVSSNRLLAEQAEPGSPLDMRLEEFYIAFENQFRGSQELIRQRLSLYLPVINRALEEGDESGVVIDIGAGRGEWLKLAAEQGWQTSGVDLNPVMVDICQDAGLDVQLNDALAFLKEKPDASVHAITGFHIVEHLPFAVLFSIVEEIRRVLVPGGVLIFETPNPENLQVGGHLFYHDPTHRNPVTPVSLEYLVRYLGFGEAEILRLNPMRAPKELPHEIQHHLYGAQDYALIAFAGSEE